MRWGPSCLCLLHSLPYEILFLFTDGPSVSSSSPAFFFLLPGLAPFAVGWLDSRVGNDDIGVAAWDGVVPAEAGVEASCDTRSAQVQATAAAAAVSLLSGTVNVPAGS